MGRSTTYSSFSGCNTAPVTTDMRTRKDRERERAKRRREGEE